MKRKYENSRLSYHEQRWNELFGDMTSVRQKKKREFTLRISPNLPKHLK